MTARLGPDGSTSLAQAPSAVELSSTAPLILSRSHVAVWDRSGLALNAGEPTLIRPDRLHQPVYITDAGDVTVTYHVTFVDGAQPTGTVRFTVETANTAGTNASVTPPSAAASTDDVVSAKAHQHDVDPLSAAILLLAGVVVLAAIVLLVRRPRPHT